MVRDRQHGPVIELNRMAVHRKAALASTSAQQAANAAGSSGAVPKSGGPAGQMVSTGSTSKTVFAQVRQSKGLLINDVTHEEGSFACLSLCDTVHEGLSILV